MHLLVALRFLPYQIAQQLHIQDLVSTSQRIVMQTKKNEEEDIWSYRNSGH